MQKLLNNHIIMSGIYKGISGMSLFLSIRLMIDYLGDENYGIWVLLFTLFQLVLLMDFGVQSTLKTKIPIYQHEGNQPKVQEIISTTYKISILIVLSIFSIFFVLLKIIDFKSIFNITNLTESEIDLLLMLNIFFFCLTFVVNIHKSLFVAFFKGKFAEQSIAVNQFLFLVIIGLFIFFYKVPLSDYNKLLLFSIINGVLSFGVNFVYSVKIFREEKLKLKILNLKNNPLFKEILNLGVKFMFLQISFLFVFSSDSYIISNAFDPSEIVAYEVINKLFQFPFMIIFAALSPLWSMFAKHYLEKDKIRLYSDFRKFNQTFIFIVLSLAILYLLTPTIISIWLKNDIIIPDYLILLTTFVTTLKIFVSFYTFFLNGIGKLSLYLIVLAISVIIKIPLSFYFVDLNLGVNSVLLSSLIIVIIWSILIPLKCYKIVASLDK